MMCWATVSACTALVQNYRGLVACRFLLGKPSSIPSRHRPNILIVLKVSWRHLTILVLCTYSPFSIPAKSSLHASRFCTLARSFQPVALVSLQQPLSPLLTVSTASLAGAGCSSSRVSGPLAWLSSASSYSATIRPRLNGLPLKNAPWQSLASRRTPLAGRAALRSGQAFGRRAPTPKCGCSSSCRTYTSRLALSTTSSQPSSIPWGSRARSRRYCSRPPLFRVWLVRHSVRVVLWQVQRADLAYYRRSWTGCCGVCHVVRNYEHRRSLHVNVLLCNWCLRGRLGHSRMGIGYTVPDAREEVSQLRHCQHFCEPRLRVLCIFVA